MAFWHIPWGYFATSCIHFQSEIVFFYCTPWHMFHRDQRAIEKKLPQIDKFVKRLYLVIWQSSKNRYLGWCISNSSAWGLEHPRASASEMNWGGYFACVLIHIIGPYLVLCSDTWQSELFNGVAAGSFFQFFRGKNFGFRVRLYGGKVALLRILLYPISKSTNSKHWM